MSEELERNTGGDPTSADAQMRRALNALYLEVPEPVARGVEEKVSARYIELRTEIMELEKQLSELRERLRWRKPEEEGMPNSYDLIECFGLIVRQEHTSRFLVESNQCLTGYYDVSEYTQVKIWYWRPLDPAPEDGE